MSFSSFGGGWAYDAIEAVRLSRTHAGDHLLHVLARTGEPLPDTGVSVSFTHAWVRYARGHKLFAGMWGVVVSLKEPTLGYVEYSEG